jgi:hypothetical protein
MVDFGGSRLDDRVKKVDQSLGVRAFEVMTM